MGEEFTERGTTSPSLVRIEGTGTERENSAGETITIILPSPSNGSGKHVPRYLRASVGSCHDLCKYGIKHDFEAKKKFLLRRTSFGGKGKIPDEEHEQSDIVIDQKGITKKPELKVKMSKPKVGFKSEVSKHKMPPEKVFQLCDLPTNIAEGSFEVEGSSALKVTPLASDPGSAGPSLDEGPSVKIKLVIPSPIQEGGASDEDKPGSTEGLFDGPSSMQSGSVSPNGSHVNLEEGSSVEPDSIKLMILSADNVAEGSLEECLSLAPTAPAETTTLANGEVGSSEKALNTKKKIPSVRSSMLTANTKIQTPSIVRRTSASSKEQSQVTSLKARKGENREVRKPKIGDEIVEVPGKSKMTKKNDNVNGELNRKKKPSSPVTRTTTSDKQRVNEKKNLCGKDSMVYNANDLSAKSADSSTGDSVLVKSRAASSSSQSRAGQNIQEKKITKDADLPCIAKEKVLKPLKPSLLVKPPIKSVSSMKLRKYNKGRSNERLVGRTDSGADKVKGKFLHVIEPKAEKIDLKTIKKKKFCRVKSSSALTSTSLRSISVRGKGEHGSMLVSDKERLDKRNQTDIVKGESKGRSRRSASLIDDKLLSPHKVNFRRGKIVNIPSENSEPRRLTFRPAKVASESWNAKGEVGGRSFRRRRNSVDMSTPTLKAPIVQLRHQDVQDKKDTQGLFNHVIEETASKLVETRKSKVKALVGAFETVISLQESKAAPTVAVP